MSGCRRPRDSEGTSCRDVALLYAAYDARLREGGRDARSRVQKLRDALPQSDYLRDKDVFFDGFSYFNKVEEGILETILQQAHSITVTLLGDRSASDIFQNAFRQRQRLVRMARQTGQRCEMEFMERQENSPWDIWNGTFSGRRPRSGPAERTR